MLHPPIEDLLGEVDMEIEFEVLGFDLLVVAEGGGVVFVGGTVGLGSLGLGGGGGHGLSYCVCVEV